ncbi:MAG: TIGR02757 family protein [bacterium]|nr:TIGR02757 family protein [bacterium]
MARRKENTVDVKNSPDLPGFAISFDILESLYTKYNHRSYVSPDPLQFLYDYPDPLDREIVGLIASSLAYGRVSQILKSVTKVLCELENPRDFIARTSKSRLRKIFKDFKHRFTTGENLADLLYGVGKVVQKYKSIENCFVSGISDKDENILPGLAKLVNEISMEAGCDFPMLLPDPSMGSACKRLNLYLRWMIRRDDVDPGGWEKIKPSRLLVPLDVHMFRICSNLAMTCRKQANLLTVIEITNAFRKINPDDPVKYDFAITRLGIREELSPDAFIDSCRKE